MQQSYYDKNSSIAEASSQALTSTITPNNKNIYVIRFSQKDSNVVRDVFELKAEAEYNIKESDDLIEVSFKEATYKNLSYNASKDDAYITLYNVFRLNTIPLC